MSEEPELREYRVTWEIDVSASSHVEAAQKALLIQRDPESQAQVFTVTDTETGNVRTVDVYLKAVEAYARWFMDLH